jgi:hypothetical protein
VADVDDRTVRRWLDGTPTLKGTARQLCRAIVADPTIVEQIRLDTTDRAR